MVSSLAAGKNCPAILGIIEEGRGESATKRNRHAEFLRGETVSELSIRLPSDWNSLMRNYLTLAIVGFALSVSFVAISGEAITRRARILPDGARLTSSV